MITLELNKDLLWESDWNGDEVGYDDVSIVGLYRLVHTNIHFYIDMETGKVLEAWKSCECLCDCEEDNGTTITYSEERGTKLQLLKRYGYKEDLDGFMRVYSYGDLCVTYHVSESQIDCSNYLGLLQLLDNIKIEVVQKLTKTPEEEEELAKQLFNDAIFYYSRKQ